VVIINVECDRRDDLNYQISEREGLPTCMEKECVKKRFGCIHLVDYITHLHDADSCMGGGSTFPEFVQVPIALIERRIEVRVRLSEKHSEVYDARANLGSYHGMVRLGFVHIGAGRKVLRNMIINWLNFYFVSKDKHECSSPQHAYPHQLRFSEHLKRMSLGREDTPSYVDVLSLVQFNMCSWCSGLWVPPKVNANTTISPKDLVPKPIKYNQTKGGR
jgi:hypothetical protein